MAAVLSSSDVPRGPVTAVLNYYDPPKDNSEPFNLVDPTPDQPRRNWGDNPQNVTIEDIRGREASFTLDKDAFQVLQSVPESAEKDFADDESIKQNYYPEVEDLLLKHIPGSNRIFIFDHTIRKAQNTASDDTVQRAPVPSAHIDQTAPAVAQRVRRYFPDEAEALLKGRYRIVNVWRPLNKKPVETFPLAFASTSSLRNEDVVSISHRYRDGYSGWTAAIKHNPEQKWYYLSGMTGRERIFLECFDSESLKEGSGIGGRVPHSAFVDPRSREGAEPRESIEVRALVFGP